MAPRQPDARSPITDDAVRLEMNVRAHGMVRAAESLLGLVCELRGLVLLDDAAATVARVDQQRRRIEPRRATIDAVVDDIEQEARAHLARLEAHYYRAEPLQPSR